MAASKTSSPSLVRTRHSTAPAIFFHTLVTAFLKEVLFKSWAFDLNAAYPWMAFAIAKLLEKTAHSLRQMPVTMQLGNLGSTDVVDF